MAKRNQEVAAVEGEVESTALDPIAMGSELRSVGWVQFNPDTDVGQALVGRLSFALHDFKGPEKKGEEKTAILTLQDGTQYRLPNHAVLMSKLQMAEEGQLVGVQFTGAIRQKTKWGMKDVYQYRVVTLSEKDFQRLVEAQHASLSPVKLLQAPMDGTAE